MFGSDARDAKSNQKAHTFPHQSFNFFKIKNCERVVKLNLDVIVYMSLDATGVQIKWILTWNSMSCKKSQKIEPP